MSMDSYADALWLDLESAREGSLVRAGAHRLAVELRRYVRRQPARYFSAAALAGLCLALLLPR